MLSNVKVVAQFWDNKVFFLVNEMYTSEDMRDQAFTEFRSRLCGDAPWAKITYLESPAGTPIFQWRIDPITAKELREEALKMLNLADAIENPKPIDPPREVFS